MGVCLSLVQPNKLFLKEAKGSKAYKEKLKIWNKTQSLINAVENPHHKTCLTVVNRFIKHYLEKGIQDPALLIHQADEGVLPEYWVHFLVLHQDYAFLALLIENGAPLQCPSDCRHENLNDATVLYHLNPLISEERDLTKLSEDELLAQDGIKADRANSKFESPESPRGAATPAIPEVKQSAAESESLKAAADVSVQKDLSLLIKTILIHSSRDFLKINSIASNRTPLQFCLISKEWVFDDVRIVLGKLDPIDVWEQFGANAWGVEGNFGNCMNFCIQCRVRTEEQIIEMLEFTRSSWKLKSGGSAENRDYDNQTVLFFKQWYETAVKREKYYPNVIKYFQSIIPLNVLKAMEEAAKAAATEVKNITIQISIPSQDDEDEKKS